MKKLLTSLFIMLLAASVLTGAVPEKFASGKWRCRTTADKVEIAFAGKPFAVISINKALLTLAAKPGSEFCKDFFGGKEFTGKYQLTRIKLTDKRELLLRFKSTITGQHSEMPLEKFFYFTSDGKEVYVSVHIFNEGKKSEKPDYGVSHKTSVSAPVFLQGTGKIELGEGRTYSFFPYDSNYAKIGDIYIGWARSIPDKFTFTNRGGITFAAETVRSVIRPGRRNYFRTEHIIRFISANEVHDKAWKTPAEFTVSNSYAVKKQNAWRASLHNHSKYAPSYKHSNWDSARRLTSYRDAKVNPPYKVVVITEHGRLTLPENTIPVGKEPQWGVEGILFVPGMERNTGIKKNLIGSWLYGRTRDFTGELNCVGLSREYTMVNGVKKYKHVYSGINADEIIKRYINDGVFIAVCHPNANPTRNWVASGWTYDELDMIFGNSEKGFSGFPVLPHAVEIGNQNYDLNARGNVPGQPFRNAEAKWDYLLSQGHKLHGTASDDSHNASVMGGWVVVFMNELTEKEFINSMKSGNFYASQGPEIKEIKLDGKKLTVRADLPSRIEFIGRYGKVLKSEENVTVSSYDINGSEMYVRAKITRLCPEMRKIEGGIGQIRSAWTNPFYITPAKQ